MTAPGWLRTVLGASEFWLFSIAGLGMVAVGGIAAAIIINGRVPEGAGEIIASIVTGFLLVARDVIAAIRARWGVSADGPPTPPFAEQDPASPPVDRGE